MMMRKDELKTTEEWTTYEEEQARKAKKSILNGALLIGLLILGLLVLIALFGAFFIVDAGERAVLLTFGNPSIESYGSGIHMKVPIVQSVVKFEVRTQKYEAEASAASMDLQTVTSKIAINYHLIPEDVPRLYRELGKDYQSRVIQPLEQETVKAITAKFTAEELITKREIVREEIRDSLKENLAPRGIIVEEVSIVNFDFSRVFNEAIEAKVTAEQLKLKADRDLQRIQVEAEQKIASARAEAESLRLQKQEITPDLVRLRQIEVSKIAVDKWDGKMPIVVGGATPFIDISSILGANSS
jgi:prohibitin 2